jgi:hypothetical protein
VIIGLEELERRARAASLDFGSQLHPADLRLLACDARMVPIVMNGAGQPLDVCSRPASWCELHHITG